jgi:hypothetical protein
MVYSEDDIMDYYFMLAHFQKFGCLTIDYWFSEQEMVLLGLKTQSQSLIILAH